MPVVTGANIYTDGVKRNSTPVSLTGTFNLSAWYNPLDNVSVESTLVYDDGTESPKSNIVQFQLASDTVTYDPLYQAVLDQATTDGVTKPLLSQSLENDAIARKLRAKNLLDMDLFYWFKQDDASLYEFCTYNWMNPAAHRLTNEGANPVDFVPGQGFKVTGNDQHFSTNFVPSTDAVHALLADHSLVFNQFDVDTTGENRIFGGRGPEGQNYQINVYKGSGGTSLYKAIYENHTGTNQSLTLDELENQLALGIEGGNKYLALEYNYTIAAAPTLTQLTTVPIHIFAINVNGTHVDSTSAHGLEFLAFGAGRTEEQNIDLNNIFNSGNIFQGTEAGVLRFEAINSALTSLYYPQVELASKYPQLTTTKKWIVLYSTDHSTTGGGIAWGDCDNIDLSDFTERGVVWSGSYQPETPHLSYVPNDPNGEFIHLKIHTDSTDPANGGYQQTKLLTTAGGAELHNCTWTERGPVLGIVNPGTDENHTGYCSDFEQGDGSFVAIHHTKDYGGASISQINRFGKSTNPGNSYVWTRVSSYIDNTSFMPPGRAFHMSPPFFFERNGVQYSIGLNVGYDYAVQGRSVCIVKCAANDYLPTELIGNITTENGGDNLKICGYKIDPALPDILNLFYTKTSGNDYSVPGTELYHTTWDLKQLD